MLIPYWSKIIITVIIMLPGWLYTTSNPAPVSVGKDRGKLYHGTLIDSDGKQLDLQEITIAGVSENIIVYERPQNITDREYNPYTDQRTICIKEIAKIEPLLVDNKPEIVEFRKAEMIPQKSGRKPTYTNYITIQITFYDKEKKERNNQPQAYIIEENRYIEGKVAHGRKKISFARIKSLTIQHTDRQADCNDAKELVAQLTEDHDSAQKPETKSKITRMIDRLKKWIFNTCD